MRRLWLNNLFFCILIGCSTPYKSLQKSTETKCTALHFTQFEILKYRATIDVVGKHLSGILIFKTMPDSSIRTVFINEMGSTFFDFTYYKSSTVVNAVIENLNKKAVLKTLKKDIGMLLLKGIFTSTKPNSLTSNTEYYTQFFLQKGSVFYITNKTTCQTNNIENWGKHKKIISIYNSQFTQPASLADSIFIKHHTVNFTILLKKMETQVTD